jgi:hypothetical protein
MTTSHSSVRIAVLDDYQGVAREMADWSHVEERARRCVLRSSYRRRCRGRPATTSTRFTCTGIALN